MFDLDRYGPVISELLDTQRLPSLGPGKPDRQACRTLESLRAETLFGDVPVRRLEMAQACLAGLWLHFDDLDRSHRISQELHNPTGSYWHGVMHRREPDYSNAKYWFRRVGQHPVYVQLAEQLPSWAAEAKVQLDVENLALFEGPEWDAFAMVDACQRAYAAGDNSALGQFVRRLQFAEWQLLFHFCFEQATE